MKSLAPVLAVVLGFLTAAAAPLSTDSLQDLLSKKHYREYQSKDKYKDRIDVLRKAMEDEMDTLRKQVEDRNIDEILVSLHRLARLAEFAQQDKPSPSHRKDAKSRQVKKMEIRLRKMSENVVDLKRSVPFEYRQEFDVTNKALETLRDQLLVQLFGKPAKSITPEPSASLAVPGQAVPVAFSWVPPAATTQTMALANADRFTDKEYVKIQERQDLKGRADVFLDIAKSRLDEIERRSQHKPRVSEDDKGEKGKQEKKEENPLEFFTYTDMVHAYDRALNSLMINIDEQMSRKIVKEKDLKKVLEKLNKEVTEFMPRLEAVKQLAIDRKDEQLYREVEKAQKTSALARKGSLLGLGAPAK